MNVYFGKFGDKNEKSKEFFFIWEATQYQPLFHMEKNLD
jgi:predicted secreted protein